MLCSLVRIISHRLGTSKEDEREREQGELYGKIRMDRSSHVLILLLSLHL